MTTHHDRLNGLFVGRHREMGELRVAFTHALSGQGRLVMLTGDPGIGKTRTAQELATYARQQGAYVLWGRCSENAPTYWPWIQAIRSYIQQTNLEQLEPETESGSANIASIGLELLGDLTRMDSPPVQEPELARSRLFDSITTFLKNASQKQPLVLVLEDLHSSDSPSLLLLRFLANVMGESRLLVVGTYRDMEVSRQHPLLEVLAELSRELWFQRLQLHGLGLEDTKHFIETMAGIKASKVLVDTIYTHTEGNPFFMAEVVRLLLEQGELTGEEISGPQDLRMPESVRDVIKHTLTRLSDQCSQTLITASIIGREFDFKLLSILSDKIAEDQLLDVIDEALDAHLISELPGVMDRYQFIHALVQQTLSQELSTSRRVRLHARIALALEDLYGDDVGTHASELAYHFAGASSITGSEKLVHYSLISGEHALATYAYDEALSYFQRGLAEKKNQSMDTETAALLRGLGHTQAAMNRVEEGVANLKIAFDYYVTSRDISQLIAIAGYPYSLPYILLMSDLISQALEFAPTDSRDEGYVLANYGLSLGLTCDDYGPTQAAFDRAIEISRRVDDPALEVRVLANNGQVAAEHLRWEECLDQCMRVIDLAQQFNDLNTKLRAHLWVAIALVVQGRPNEASIHARESVTIAENLRDNFWLGSSLFLMTQLAYLRGDWEAARELSDRSLSILPEGTHTLAIRALLEYQVGEVDQGKPYLDRLLETLINSDFVSIPIGILAIGTINLITPVAERLDVAKSVAEVVMSSGKGTPNTALLVRTGLALIEINTQDVQAISEQYSALALNVGSLIPSGGISLGHVLGLLAQRMGSFDSAVYHFENALSFCRTAGYLPEFGWICFDYANALIQHNNVDDLPKAMALLHDALATSIKLGMRPLANRVMDLRKEVESQNFSIPAYPDSLTQREVEVLRLIAQGKRNQEIARELVLSVHTVNSHLTNIFSKIGVANRAEATAYAMRHKLLPEAASTKEEETFNEQNKSYHMMYPDLPEGLLTKREIEVLRLIAKGNTNIEISEALGIKPKTVAVHVANLLGKIDTRNRTGAATYAVQHGLVE